MENENHNLLNPNQHHPADLNSEADREKMQRQTSTIATYDPSELEGKAPDEFDRQGSPDRRSMKVALPAEHEMGLNEVLHWEERDNEEQKEPNADENIPVDSAIANLSNQKDGSLSGQFEASDRSPDGNSSRDNSMNMSGVSSGRKKKHRNTKVKNRKPANRGVQTPKSNSQTAPKSLQPRTPKNKDTKAKSNLVEVKVEAVVELKEEHDPKLEAEEEKHLAPSTEPALSQEIQSTPQNVEEISAQQPPDDVQAEAQAKPFSDEANAEVDQNEPLSSQDLSAAQQLPVDVEHPINEESNPAVQDEPKEELPQEHTSEELKTELKTELKEDSKNEPNEEPPAEPWEGLSAELHKTCADLAEEPTVEAHEELWEEHQEEPRQNESEQPHVETQEELKEELWGDVKEEDEEQPMDGVVEEGRNEPEIGGCHEEGEEPLDEVEDVEPRSDGEGMDEGIVEQDRDYVEEFGLEAGEAVFGESEEWIHEVEISQPQEGKLAPKLEVHLDKNNHHDEKVHKDHGDHKEQENLIQREVKDIYEENKEPANIKDSITGEFEIIESPTQPADESHHSEEKEHLKSDDHDLDDRGKEAHQEEIKEDTPVEKSDVSPEHSQQEGKDEGDQQLNEDPELPADQKNAEEEASQPKEEVKDPDATQAKDNIALNELLKVIEEAEAVKNEGNAIFKESSEPSEDQLKRAREKYMRSSEILIARSTELEKIPELKSRYLEICKSALMNAAMMGLKLKEFQQTLDILKFTKTLFTKDEDCSKLHYRMAVCLNGMSRHKEAFEILKTIGEIKDPLVKIEYNKALTAIKEDKKISDSQKETYAKMFSPEKRKEEQIKQKEERKKKNEEKLKKNDKNEESSIAKYVFGAAVVGVAGLLLYKSLSKKS